MTTALYGGANYGAATYGSGTYGYPVGSGTPQRRNRLSKSDARLLLALEAEQEALAAERARELAQQRESQRQAPVLAQRNVAKRVAKPLAPPAPVIATMVADVALVPTMAERARQARQRDDEEALMMLLTNL